MQNSVFDFLEKQDIKYKRNVKLSTISTIRIGGFCKAVAFPNTEEKLINLVDFLYHSGTKYKVVGNASNILFSDLGFDGIIISTRSFRHYTVNGLLVEASAGTSLSSLIRELAKINLGGLEGLFGIPATVGGAVRNNAGAFGQDISRVLLYARLYSPKTKKILYFDNCAMNFSYRKSYLSDRNITLLSATLAFAKKDYSEIKNDLQRIAFKRSSTQPIGEASLGSVFKRESGIPISKIIDELGLKGFKIGGAEISSKHAGFIVNKGNATAGDVQNLVEYIKSEICMKIGIIPCEEIEFLE